MFKKSKSSKRFEFILGGWAGVSATRAYRGEKLQARERQEPSPCLCSNLERSLAAIADGARPV